MWTKKTGAAHSKFATDVSDPNYPAQFTWIEPNYGHVASDYIGGSSQHPLDGVTGGEALIRATYEAIRNSPLWESSMLIITWDEHGGFFDHAPPPPATPPGDKAQFTGATKML
jgi:phospholipase C